MIKLVHTLIALIISINVLTAESKWNPKDLLVDNEKAFELLNNSDVLELKNQIYAYLKNSWCSQDKAELLFELTLITQPKVCVEIGPFTGSSTLALLGALKYLKKGCVYAIDPWSNAEAIKGLPQTDPNTLWWAGVDMQIIKNQFIQMIFQWEFSAFCYILPITSEQASLYISSIDFLHLDGNFSQAGALLDSLLYLPKVVSGGYVLLSNALVMVEGKAMKMKALWPIFDQCDVVCEIEHGNTLLFRKK